jgi:hypothetical protein
MSIDPNRLIDANRAARELGIDAAELIAMCEDPRNLEMHGGQVGAFYLIYQHSIEKLRARRATHTTTEGQ